jgi:hypothetical protein
LPPVPILAVRVGKILDKAFPIDKGLRNYKMERLQRKLVYHYDFKRDRIGDELIYTQMYKELINNGSVQMDACYIKQHGERVFLSIFVIIQTNFIGMQSIMTDITQRVQSQRVQKRLTHRFYHLISRVEKFHPLHFVLEI